MKTLNPAAPVARLEESSLRRIAIFAYGVTCYLIGVTGLCWLIATTLDLIPFTGGALTTSGLAGAIAINLALIAVFGIQHAIMARPAFKQRWRQVLPKSTERSTFVLGAGVTMSLAMWLFQPLPAVVWSFESPAVQVVLRTLCVLGWGYLFASTFAIDHFELFGLRQVYLNLRNRDSGAPAFVQRWMYRFDRHPIMSGALIGLWATPIMRRREIRGP